MAAFIARRLGVLFVILFGSSFILFNLAAIAGDPLDELRVSSDPRAKQQIINLTRQLDLDTPPPLRYFKWLSKVTQLDFGKTREAQQVSDALLAAIPTTIRLVLAATIIAIILGIALGIVSALRQYSRFDYSMTFFAFLLYSLPVFWVAVLLKQYLAISFNDFLEDPEFGKKAMLIAAAASGVFWSAVISGSRKRVLQVFAIAFVVTGAILYFISSTLWLADPYLGPIVTFAISVGIAFAVTQLSVGIGHKPSLYSALTMAVIGLIMYFPAQTIFEWENRRFLWPALIAITVVVAVVTALIFAKIDRGPVIRTSVITSLLVIFVILVDKMLRTVKPYMATDAVNYRLVPTFGQDNTLLEKGNFWLTFFDTAIHLVLPTFALLLISFAGYIRFSRGTLLEVLNQDYIRTARAKGLPERTVIMRHAFRNTLIPLTTIIVVDFAGIIGGAIITERVFGWRGMGTLFNMAISSFDLNLLMGVFFVTSTLAVLANLVADLLYSALDPRIRVGGGK